MKSKLSLRLICSIIACGVAIALFAQQSSKRTISVEGAPSEPIAIGTCTSSTFGYLDLNGKTADFTNEEIGAMIMPALRQGYVITLYPPTKRGIFVEQECHNTAK